MFRPESESQQQGQPPPSAVDGNVNDDDDRLSYLSHTLPGDDTLPSSRVKRTTTSVPAIQMTPSEYPEIVEMNQYSVGNHIGNFNDPRRPGSHQRTRTRSGLRKISSSRMEGPNNAVVPMEDLEPYPRPPHSSTVQSDTTTVISVERVSTRCCRCCCCCSGGSDSSGMNCCECILMGLSILCVIITFPFSLFICLRFVKEYQRAVVLRLGRQHEHSLKLPGLAIVLPLVDQCVKVDLRTRMLTMKPQRVLSCDCVTLSVDAVVFYKITQPMVAVLCVEDAHQATLLLAQTILRNAIATRNLVSVLTKREQMAEEMTEAMQFPARGWGVKIERIEVKDIRIPTEMQRAMAAEAEANRIACARLISSEAERDASPFLVGAAQNLQQEPISLQLRYLQTLSDISAENNATVIIPLPAEMLMKSLKRH